MTKKLITSAYNKVMLILDKFFLKYEGGGGVEGGKRWVEKGGGVEVGWRGVKKKLPSKIPALLGLSCSKTCAAAGIKS